MSPVAVCSTPRRRRVFLCLLALACVLLVPAGIPLLAWSHLRDPVLLGGLIALSLCSVLSEIRLRRTTHLLPDEAIVTLILLIGGPLPAAVALLLQDLPMRVWMKRLPLRTPGALATYASYFWAMLTGAAILHLAHATDLGARSAPTVFAVGIGWLAVNWILARALPEVLWHGHAPGNLAREELLAALPMHLALALAAALCAAATPLLGTVGVLCVIAPTTLATTLALPLLARSRSVARLEPAHATRLYVRALAAHLGVARSERRVALAAARLAQLARPSGRPAPELGLGGVGIGDLLPPADAGLELAAGEAVRAWAAARQAADRCDGQDRPGGYPRTHVLPLSSRLLAVALEWSKLTARGGPQLPQAHAILALEAQAATRLDPLIVQAAGEIVATESQFADLERFAPKLDLLPLPRLARTRLLPWALRSCATG